MILINKSNKLNSLIFNEKTLKKQQIKVFINN